MKNNFNDINQEKFLHNRKKRKSNTKKTNNAPRNRTAPNKQQPSKTDNRITTIIVCFVLISIVFTLSSLMVFSPSFRTLAVRHILSAVSADSGLKNVHDTENSMSDGIDHTVISHDGEKAKLSKDIYTFLATGTDHSGNLTDVIMIAKFNTADSCADILQIPRDTYVKLSGTLIIDDNGNISSDNFSSGYETKINSVYSTGKSLSKAPINKLLKEAEGKNVTKIQALCTSNEFSYLGVTQQQVSRYLNEKDNGKKKELISNMQKNFGIKYLSTLIYYSYGIPIDYHAQVNTGGFRNIVDAIGGVDIYVPQNMYHYDPTQDLYINLKKGQQHLNGDKAEQFVRFRGYALGDIDRIDAQKSFMSAFMNKLFSPSTITKISQITSVIQDNLYTNLTLQETADFASKLLDMDLSQGFSMTTLPGLPVDVTRGGVWVSYYSADKTGVMELVNKSFNKYDKDLPEEMFGLLTLSSSPAIKGNTVVGTDNTDITPVSTVTGPSIVDDEEAPSSDDNTKVDSPTTSETQAEDNTDVETDIETDIDNTNSGTTVDEDNDNSLDLSDSEETFNTQESNSTEYADEEPQVTDNSNVTSFTQVGESATEQAA